MGKSATSTHKISAASVSGEQITFTFRKEKIEDVITDMNKQNTLQTQNNTNLGDSEITDISDINMVDPSTDTDASVSQDSSEEPIEVQVPGQAVSLIFGSKSSEFGLRYGD